MSRKRQRSASFGAPWARSVTILTLLTLAVLLVMMIVMPLTMPREAWWAAWLGPGLLALILGITALFCVRGYRLEHGTLCIRRLFWETRIPLDDLHKAWTAPGLMKGSIRAAGNGGFTAFTGWFQNKQLGRYRAFVTDPSRCVVLECDSRKWVVSPDRPAAFIRALGLDSEAAD